MESKKPVNVVAMPTSTPFLLEAEKLFSSLSTTEDWRERDCSGEDHRLRRLLELKMLCNLSKELSLKTQNLNLLDHLAEQAVKVTLSQFSQILTWEPDGSFICQVSFDARPADQQAVAPYRVPINSWLHYLQIINQNKPTILKRDDPNISEDERKALRLDIVDELWLLPLWAGSEKIGLFVLGDDSKARAGRQNYDRLGQMTPIADQATIGIQRKRIQKNLEKSFVEIILALAENIEVDAHSSNRHEHHTSVIVTTIASSLGFPPSEVQSLQWAGLLHDIGKMQIPEDLLQKPGPLTEDEWEIMREHPVIGADMLSTISLLKDVVPVIKHHHEKYDGSGYPLGLKGEAIPIGARILTVADAYSVIVGGRVYREPRSQQDAVKELQRCSGKHFDPCIVEKFVELINAGLIY